MSVKAENTDILDAEEVAAMFRLDRTTVIRYTKRRLIPGKKIGYVYRYSRAEIERMMPGAVESPARGNHDESSQVQARAS